MFHEAKSALGKVGLAMAKKMDEISRERGLSARNALLQVGRECPELYTAQRALERRIKREENQVRAFVADKHGRIVAEIPDRAEESLLEAIHTHPDLMRSVGLDSKVQL